VSPRPFTLRPATPADRPWLWETKKLCLRTYIEETWGFWDEDVQRAHFDTTFEPAEISIVSLAGRDAGYIAALRGPQEIQLFNIMIAPEFQRCGLGTAVMRDLLAEAQTRRVPVRLQVLKVNPARRLYERLGFATFEETATHFRMRWQPA
jgi:ribosomal protein S18 acetylase RimI-like enzyme